MPYLVVSATAVVSCSAAFVVSAACSAASSGFAAPAEAFSAFFITSEERRTEAPSYYNNNLFNIVNKVNSKVIWSIGLALFFLSLIPVVTKTRFT